MNIFPESVERQNLIFRSMMNLPSWLSLEGVRKKLDEVVTKWRPEQERILSMRD